MFRAVTVAALLVSACAGAELDGTSPPVRAGVVPPCQVGGCSSQVCSERDDVVTTCEWRDEYACYRGARCEPQGDGRCGWTPTPELLACLESARKD
jgi:eight-cysteine-cluster-containing protein